MTTQEILESVVELKLVGAGKKTTPKNRHTMLKALRRLSRDDIAFAQRVGFDPDVIDAEIGRIAN
jgi:hypothetical protein